MARTATNKICLECGAKLAQNSKFCNECGTKWEPPKVEPKPKEVVSAILVRKMVYTVEEAAKALGVSVSFISKLAAKNEIPICRQGKKVGFTEWALEEYARAHEIIPEGYLRGEVDVL